jgi:acyl dehydratase
MTVSSITFPVEPGHVMLFARAIADPNPIYSDSEHAAGTDLGRIIAPPTFTEALQQFLPDYAFRPAAGTPWLGSASKPSGVGEPAEGGTTFHAEQHFTYHGVVYAGDVLTATMREGNVWEKSGRRGGRLVFRERITEFRNEEGTLVVTSRIVSVETERTVPVSR